MYKKTLAYFNIAHEKYHTYKELIIITSRIIIINIEKVSLLLITNTYYIECVLPL